VSIPSDGTPAVTRPRVPAEQDARAATRMAVVVSVGCLLLVGVLAAGVRAGFAPQLRLDTAVSTALYAGDHRSWLVKAVLYVLTGPGYSVPRLVPALLLVVWLLRRRARWAAGWVALAYGLIGPITSLGKYLVARERPPFPQG